MSRIVEIQKREGFFVSFQSVFYRSWVASIQQGDDDHLLFVGNPLVFGFATEIATDFSRTE